jgi:hypothetical protein
MTLTHIIPSLRRTMASPMDQDRWPEFTTTSLDDVTIAGVSMCRLVEWCGSPAIHTAAAVIPFTGGRPSEAELVSVVVARVIVVDHVDGQPSDVWLDADLHTCRPVQNQTRLVGRVSTAPDMPVRLHPADAIFDEALAPQLPFDLRVGDLLVVPCEGVTRLEQVDTHRRHGSTANGNRDKQGGPLPQCGK